MKQFDYRTKRLIDLIFEKRTIKMLMGGEIYEPQNVDDVKMLLEMQKLSKPEQRKISLAVLRRLNEKLVDSQKK